MCVCVCVCVRVCLCVRANVFVCVGSEMCIRDRDVPLVELMYFVVTRMSVESYRRQLGSLLSYLCMR